MSNDPSPGSGPSLRRRWLRDDCAPALQVIRAKVMPIRAHLSEYTAFEPEEIIAMSTAFELACADLHVFADDQRGRDIIAARIIDLARSSGVIDAAALHKRVVLEARVGA